MMKVVEKVKEINRLIDLAEKRLPGAKETLLMHLNIWLRNESLEDPMTLNFLAQNGIKERVEKDLLTVKDYLNAIEPEQFELCQECNSTFKTYWYDKKECPNCKK